MPVGGPTRGPVARVKPPPVSNGDGCLTAVAPALVCNRIPTHWTVMCKYTVRACTGNVNPSDLRRVRTCNLAAGSGAVAGVCLSASVPLWKHCYHHLDHHHPHPTLERSPPSLSSSIP